MKNRLNRTEIISKTVKYVRKELLGESSGHDWWHILRVWNNAKHIGKSEKVDMFVVELAALLHDIADWKFHGGDENVGAIKAKKWLKTLDVDAKTIDHVCDIIATSSFKGARQKTKMKTKEGEVVQDADRLDAIGAIGIGRTFAYGGHKGREMHNPNIPPQLGQTKEQYKSSRSNTINHFYEKLLLLKGLMNTKTAKKIAKGRHKFMEKFLNKFLDEWNGKS
ncbi:MAG: phosphohydrolase [Bacteroidetes bacterium RIFCSPHIGHO2_02_FULL_44_7]|nr:MAG: phosphohydrolase [Bacteroidetes bacterium RIFCSPHIGHO2_02_FULL_44_7]